MGNGITVFTNEKFGEIRTIEIGSQNVQILRKCN